MSDSQDGEKPHPDQNPDQKPPDGGLEVSAIETFSEEQVDAIVQEADDEVRALEDGGETTATKIAETLDTEIDPETSGALREIETEAETAEAELNTAIVEAEKVHDFTSLIVELNDAAKGCVGADGELDENIFGQLSPEEKERIQVAFSSFEEAIQSDPIEFFAATEALQILKNGVLKKDYLGTLCRAAEKIAESDPGAAFDAYRNATDDAAAQEQRKRFDVRFFETERKKIAQILTENPIAAANDFVKIEGRARELELIGLDRDAAEIAEKIKEEVRKAIEGGADGVALYRQLADTAPGDQVVASILVEKALAKEPNKDWEGRKQVAIATLGETAPEALLVAAIGQYTYMAWTPEERATIIEKISRLPDAKTSILAEVGPGLPENLSREVRRALFDAYLRHKPESIINYAGRFPEEIAALPEQERNQMIDGAIKGDPFSIVRQADAWRSVLTDEQRKNIVLSIVEQRILDQGNQGEFLLTKMPEVAAAFTPEIIDMAISAQPHTVLQLMDRGRIILTVPQQKEMVISLAVHGMLYPDSIKQLEKVGALSSEAIDAVIDFQPALMLRFIAEKKLQVTASQAKQAMVRRFTADTSPTFSTENVENVAVEFGVKFSEEEAWKILDTMMENGYITNSDALGCLKRLLSAGEVEPRLTKLVNAAERIVNSPSASLRRLSRELLGQLRSVEDPEAAFSQIEGIFERNQLPLTGKLYKVFETLYPKERLEKMAQAEHCSPTLRAESHRGRMLTIYKDLLSVQLDSANPSLRSYLETLRGGEDLMNKVDTEGIDALTVDEQRLFESFVEKIKRLHQTSLAGRLQEGGAPANKEETSDVYRGLRESLSVKEGQTLNGRIAEMYLKPLGLETIAQALERMGTARASADQRNRESVANGNGQIEMKPGDLIKGFESYHLRNILENGSVAREFLGGDADSDRTPFDTDLWRLQPGDTEAGFAGAVALTSVGTYGDTFMVVRDRGQFQETTATDDPATLQREARKRESRLELFKTGVWGERHFGIRTGLPSTEIAAIGFSKKVTDDPQRFESRVMDIVANGVYIPVVDQEGQILLTPEQFDEYRARYFGGIDGEPFRKKESAMENARMHADAVQAVIEEKRKEKAVVERMNTELRDLIAAVLTAQGIEMSAGFDEILTSAEIYDTGSSSRDTNVPGSYDFDFILKLNAIDLPKAAALNAAIVAKLGGTLHEGHRPKQLRVLGAPVGGETVDVDVGFVSKSEGAQYESHDAANDRLDAVRRDFGDEAHERVVANIVLTKKILKEGHAYKKVEDGGIGGIGVENWILSEGGSALVAFESFEKAAFDGEKLRSLEEFKKDYKVLDPGINAKTGDHGNFIEHLTGDGYRKMAETIQQYLKKVRASA